MPEVTTPLGLSDDQPLPTRSMRVATRAIALNGDE
jgi:hypothetical protein